jgi:hypothetical protein
LARTQVKEMRYDGARRMASLETVRELSFGGNSNASA